MPALYLQSCKRCRRRPSPAIGASLACMVLSVCSAASVIYLCACTPAGDPKGLQSLTMAALAFSYHTAGLAARAGGCVDRDQPRCAASGAGASRRRPCSQSTRPAAPSVAQRPAQRRLDIACAASSSASSSAGSATGDYAALQGRTVYSAASGTEVELPSLWRAEPGKRCIVVFLTHFADLSSTELAQKLKAVLPEVRTDGKKGGRAGKECCGAVACSGPLP